jgi:hypothetical protein
MVLILALAALGAKNEAARQVASGGWGWYDRVMGKRTVRHGWGWVGSLLLVGWFLTSCQAETAVPTLAVVAAAPTEVGAANLPATYTPGAETAVADAQPLAQPPVLRPSLTPSAAPILPTSSPFASRTATPTATPEATATPTRYVSVIPNLPPSNELGPSKLGIHVIRNNDPAIMEFVRRSQPAVMKGVDDLGFLEEVKAVSPRTITIGRISARDQTYAGCS